MLYVEPDAGIAPVLQVIESARPGGELLLNFYYLADRRVLADIARAAGSGVHVYAIVEGNPFEISQDKVSAEITALEQAGAKVKTTPSRFQSHGGQPAFDHAKYAATAQKALIETANIDNSAFSRNREYVYTTNDQSVAKALETLFVADWTGADTDDQVRNLAPSLILSPGAAEPIISQISQPGAVCIEVEELGSDQEILDAIAAKGSQASLVVPPTRGGKDQEVLSSLVTAGVNVRVLPKTPIYLHAKLIVGGASGYIGSQNFSKTSLNNSREVGIVITSPTDLQTMSAACTQDMENGAPPS